MEKNHKHLRKAIKKNHYVGNPPMRTLSQKDLESLYGAVEDEEVWHRPQNLLKYEIHSHEYIQE